MRTSLALHLLVAVLYGWLQSLQILFSFPHSCSWGFEFFYSASLAAMAFFSVVWMLRLALVPVPYCLFSAALLNYLTFFWLGSNLSIWLSVAFEVCLQLSWGSCGVLWVLDCCSCISFTSDFSCELGEDFLDTVFKSPAESKWDFCS